MDMGAQIYMLMRREFVCVNYETLSVICND